MNIKFDKTNEKLNQMIIAAGSKNREESLKVQELLAVFLQPVVKQVLDNIGTASLIYKDVAYPESQRPEYPLDLYYDEGENYITTWQQGRAGHLATSEVSGLDTLRLTTYVIESAYSLKKQYARHANLDVIAKALDRMVQEILLKQEEHAWNVIMKALAEAESNGADHIITSTTQDAFTVHDFNRLMTLFDDINTSFSGGSTLGTYYGLSDMFVSPVVMEKIRALAYQPINTQGANQVAGTNTSGVIGLPENVRESFFRTGVAPELFGVTLHKLVELGDNKKYSALFDTYIGASTVAHSSSQFATDDQIVVGLDLTRDAFIRPIAVESETGSTISVMVDDQFVARQDMMGWYTKMEEGRACIDGKTIVGIVV